MPEDEDDDYEDDGGEEMVDMEDDEAQPENDPLQANKGKLEVQDLGRAQDENSQPLDKPPNESAPLAAQQVKPLANAGEEAYQVTGVSSQGPNNGF